ncbi:MAG: MazG family protein [Lachnospiraceae bacterium]|jgi:tetrapyrrole methylase family protein/MazG family protein|nr:MazG family protein [Lachnospiraceae bacterium]
MHTFEELVSVVKILRSEQGCSWDRKQTFESLKPCILDEAREVAEAVDKQDMDNLCEELGDVLFNVLIYSQIAEEKGCFELKDVVDGVCEKMIRRHPHVFGEQKRLSAEESLDLWNTIKKQEKNKNP